MDHVSDAASAFLIDDVDPTVREFLQEFSSTRKGRLAAIMLVHMADHYWHARPAERAGTATEDAFRAHLSANDEEFALLCDVANASKHAVLKPRKPHQRQTLISGSDQIAAGELGWDQGLWGDMRWDGPTQVVVALNDGTLRALDAAVIRCHAMWCSRLGVTLRPVHMSSSNTEQ